MVDKVAICFTILAVILQTDAQGTPSDLEITSPIYKEIPEVFRKHLIGSRLWFIYIEKLLLENLQAMDKSLLNSLKSLLDSAYNAGRWGKPPFISNETMKIVSCCIVNSHSLKPTLTFLCIF